MIIDLQKEFDEDKELLDLLNNNTNSKKNERRKYVSIKESDIIPEVDEKTKTLSKLSKSKTSNFQEDEDEKPKTNIICQIDNKELYNKVAKLLISITDKELLKSRKITSLFSIRENALAAICFFCAILIFFLSSIGLISIWCLQGIAPP